jgi:hypothetical protein
MSAPIPMPLRAAAGLAAVAIDEARRLPTRLVGLPVTAVGAALQVSLKAQQQYAELVARGDQLLGQLRPQPQGTPPWARFDEEDLAAGGAEPVHRARSRFDAAGEPAGEPLDEVAAEATYAWDLDDDVDDDMDDDEVDGAGPPDGPLGTVAAELDPITVAAVDGDGRVLGPVDSSVESSVEEEIGAVADDVSRYDGYLSGPPLPGYDAMSIPQLRARLRTLSEEQLVELVGYERATAERPPYLTMLENRLGTVRGR